MEYPHFMKLISSQTHKLLFISEILNVCVRVYVFSNLSTMAGKSEIYWEGRSNGFDAQRPSNRA